MEGLNLGGAGGLGAAGREAIIVFDPFEERFAGGCRDGGVGPPSHRQPFVPTARRYSVTCTPLDTPRSAASALRIAG
jgi:hypothetical protein